MRPNTLQQGGPLRFHAVYAAGLVAIMLVEVWCVAAWPHTTNNADPVKAELAVTLRGAAAAAAALLILATVRICRARPVRTNLLTWLLVLGNVAIALPVFPTAYQ